MAQLSSTDVALLRDS